MKTEQFSEREFKQNTNNKNELHVDCKTLWKFITKSETTQKLNGKSARQYNYPKTLKQTRKRSSSARRRSKKTQKTTNIILTAKPLRKPTKKTQKPQKLNRESC